MFCSLVDVRGNGIFAHQTRALGDKIAPILPVVDAMVNYCQ
jgi:hypothetical protein